MNKQPKSYMKARIGNLYVHREYINPHELKLTPIKIVHPDDMNKPKEIQRIIFEAEVVFKNLVHDNIKIRNIDIGFKLS